MKRILLFVLISSLFLGCGGDDSAPINPSSLCSNATGFTVTQENENILINVTSSSEPLYFQVSAVQAGSGSANSGRMITLSSLNQTIRYEDFDMHPGNTYLFYIRTACTEQIKSAWSAPKTLVFNTFCGTPKDLTVVQFIGEKGFAWTSTDDTNSYHQIEYGPQGFTLGTGTSANTTEDYYTDIAMAANTTYDFYVRSYCTVATGWSSWAGPYTYLSTANQNLCSSPTNVVATVVRNGSGQAVGANFQWARNGETNFEYTLVRDFETVNSGAISSISATGWPTITGMLQNTNYHFYVRAVCNNGSRTPWVGPKLINIGS